MAHKLSATVLACLLASVLQAASSQLIPLRKSLRSRLWTTGGGISASGRAVNEASPFLRDKRIQYQRVALLHLAINVELHCIASFKNSLLATPTALHRQPVETSSS